MSPVLIAGAGPCGLFAALTLQKHGVEFIIFERATREKLCADVGSGYDLASTSLRLLRHFGFPADEQFGGYAGISMYKMDGSPLRTLGVKDMGGMEFRSARRADLQRMLLAGLGETVDLRCGVAVASFVEDENGVTVTLSDGSTVDGSVLLACDGVRSAVRSHLNRGKPDEHHFCNVATWWGKSPLKQGSQLRELVHTTQLPEGKAAAVYMGMGTLPGSFMLVPDGDEVMWAYSKHSKQEPTAGDDLTRRGGVPGEEARQELVALLQGYAEVIRRVVEAAEPQHVVKVGLYDRQNFDLPFVSPGGRVALLGDSAHPQTPFCGQGVNMALCDAFVCATRLAKQAPVEALRAYDSEARRKSANEVVKSARSYANMTVSEGHCTCCMINMLTKWAPARMLSNDILSKDKSNEAFLAAMLSDLDLTVA